ncbi:MAG TPA: S8 family serine peptidase, partial [Tepidisphaeraceae bacterium]|nr:S8 family serine peptidase [Tepidisphaeraceae bacterium]
MIERLTPRLLFSADRPDVDPALAQRLEAAGYEPVPWRGGQVYAEPGEWIVSLRGVRGTVDRQTALAERRLAALRRGLHVKQHLGADGMFLVGAPVSFSPSIVHTALGRVLGVRFAEPNFAVWPQSIEPQGSQIAPQGAPLPNDTYFHLQYGLHNTGFGVADADVDGPEAWEFMAGVSVGTPVVVGVIDTGIDYNHPDLVGNIWTNADELPGNGVDDDANGYIDDVHGYDFVNNDGNPMDDNNHGTHVAGTIGGRGNNGVGVTGVAWNVRLMALKVFDSSGSGYLDNAIRGLNYAVQMGAVISNNSYGASSAGADDPLFLEAIQNAASAGHIFVAAAGNA